MGDTSSDNRGEDNKMETSIFKDESKLTQTKSPNNKQTSEVCSSNHEGKDIRDTPSDNEYEAIRDMPSDNEDEAMGDTTSQDGGKDDIDRPSAGEDESRLTLYLFLFKSQGLRNDSLPASSEMAEGSRQRLLQIWLFSTLPNPQTTRLEYYDVH